MKSNKPPAKKSPARPVGRPKGKRSDPAYRQHSVWLPGSLQAEVAKALVLPDGRRYEFSKLVDYLLRKWLDAGAKLPKD